VKGVRNILLLLTGLLWLARPVSLWACAACYGQSDSPMARGMNWGIFSLLAVVVCVLASIATFFVFLAKKSATVSAGKTDAPPQEPTQKL
jgi:hypothetical protein